ncbi:DNA-binding response regulator [Sphingobacterium faecium NBRC 15299]|jgi:two-component system OmpR family response regulator|uniref:response regulator transcription factor n=1 Tax=Sphingobacterium faecium TaxID=34087 RepID=UPI000D37153E|nr:response regulator transcription factor [Sphingobacterium faecium]MQP26410.1 response regulator [Sphingobacterium faecium]PTX13502.1 DNA-binding response OmpR family regulator [Sphingobacterium faecium]GEM65083.1 DNA-binding response regulator [Sphingobacterium faecium NBRC 15299]
MQILVVEDDKRISDFLIKGLEENGYMVTLCRSAEEVIADFLNIAWDLLIVDIMLPGMDGRQLVSTLRYKNCHAPVLMLSALNTVQDKVDSLDLGADDYLTKPFHFDELLSRIKALTRRSQIGFEVKKSQCIQVGALTIDKDQYKVYDGDQELELSPREFKLLMYLVENQNKAVSRIQILNAVWGINFDNQTNVVDVYISYVRNKIEKKQKYIFTVKGVGYLFKLEQ